jgi:hypothetical protein
MATLRELASLGGNGYDMGAGGTVEGYTPNLPTAIPDPSGLTVVDQLPTGTPNMDPTKGGAMAPAWQMPQGAFAPGASQNAPRLFQDPATGAWTLSEHGQFRTDPDLQANIAAHQQRVTDYWNKYQNGFIQPGQENYDPRQALSNEQYGQPSNWQSLWTNAGQQVPGMSAPTMGGGGDSSMGGTLSELSNPERVNQLSASSYGDNNPFLVR